MDHNNITKNNKNSHKHLSAIIPRSSKDQRLRSNQTVIQIENKKDIEKLENMFNHGENITVNNVTTSSNSSKHKSNLDVGKGTERNILKKNEETRGVAITDNYTLKGGKRMLKRLPFKTVQIYFTRNRLLRKRTIAFRGFDKQVYEKMENKSARNLHSLHGKMMYKINNQSRDLAANSNLNFNGVELNQTLSGISY